MRPLGTRPSPPRPGSRPPLRSSFYRLMLATAIGTAVALAAGCGGGDRYREEARQAAAPGDTMAARAREHAIRTLTAFDTGRLTKLSGGRSLREYWVDARNAEVEVAPGVHFPAWTFNGAVPGPTLRCTEGDSVIVHFKNRGTMPHSMHFHGIHAAHMDGVFEQVPPGDSLDYAFTAEPFGLHVYHCHTMPVKMHIARGLYGVFLVDPPKPRPPAREMVMVMNGFDTDLNGEDNEFYSVNGYANVYFRDYPIPVRAGERQRVYLVNMTEFDLLNSMHTHANFFDVYPTGTSLSPSVYTDVVTMGQGERAILEFTYRFTGRFLFHAHQSEFSELGWLGQFEVSAGDSARGAGRSPAPAGSVR